MVKIQTVFKHLPVLIIGIGFVLLGSCKTGVKKTDETAAKISQIMQESFGTDIDGKPVYLFTLSNKNDLRVTITNYGGTVTSLFVPDRSGNLEDIVLGFDSISGYLAGCPYFGALIGRYGNRIGNAEFSVGKETYHLAKNDGNNNLHGGKKGFDKVVWTPEIVKDSTIEKLKLTYLSVDGEEGFPGNLTSVVYYSLNNDNELVIEYEAETDKATPVNLTHHSYFNLAGKGTILDHVLTIDAAKYTPVDDELIPTGELADVAGTPFDFNSQEVIGSRIDQVKGGYDHNWVLNNQSGDLTLCATLYEPVSGRKMEMYTTEPGLQFYSGNFLDGTLTGKGDWAYQKYAGLCLESQHYPDSPNKPEFPSTILNPGEKYQTRTIYKFLADTKE